MGKIKPGKKPTVEEVKGVLEIAEAKTWKGAAQLLKDTVPLGSVSRDPKNARRHPSRNLKAVQDSLNAFGQRKAVVVRGGVIVAGNGTHEAAEALGWTHIAVVSADDLSPGQAKEYAIADNRTSELAEWDFEVLTEHIKDIPADRRDLLGFDMDEIKALVEGKYQGKWHMGHDQPLDGTMTGASMSFKATPEQALVIKSAINKLREQESDTGPEMSDGRCLELIAGDYLAG